MPATSVEAVLDTLRLAPVGPNRYRADNLRGPYPVIMGGQLLAQSIIAGLTGQDGKTVKTLHTVFARGGTAEAPVDITVEPVHGGRTMASGTVTISQGERILTRSLVLLSADEPDLIRHADKPAGFTPPPADAAGDGPGSWDIEVVGGVDISDPEAVGPAELDVWSRWAGAPADPATDQALLAYATDLFLIGTAMRPHRGVGQAQSHRTLSTGVLSHTITFHEPSPAAEWALLAQRSPYAGRGRAYGQGTIFRADGELVASFVQDSMIRPMPAGRSGGL
jgi:acyl-CoA thioesterase